MKPHPPLLAPVPVRDIACEVVELRQYTLHPGQRDTLIELFDRAFVDSQEAVGMAVMGQFRDLDAPDRFVWLRGFPGMAQRAASLAAFYGGPVWQQHRDAANATMLAFDDVHLLRPAWPGAGLPMQGRSRAPVQAQAASASAGDARPRGVVDLGIFPLHAPATPELLAFCREVMLPCLQRGGASAQGWYVTESTPNTFPQLPVHQGVHVLAGLAVFDDTATFEAFAQSQTWARDVRPALARWLKGEEESHRLVATARSAVGGALSAAGR